MYNSYYGSYRTRTFSEIFNSVEEFIEFSQSDGIKQFVAALKNDENNTLKLIYYLLYSKYGNSHISSSDENRFKARVFAIIFQHGPTWEKRLEIQAYLRGLNEDEILTGTRRIDNHAFNPGTEPSTATLEEIPYINEQNVSRFKKGKVDGYAMLEGMLNFDVTEDFLKKFADLFIKVTAPDYPLLYPDIEED